MSPGNHSKRVKSREATGLWLIENGYPGGVYMRRFPRFLSRHKKGIAASLAIFSIGLRRVLLLDLGDGVRMELVRIQAGKFQMGSPPGEKERRGDEDQHGVEITRDFYLGKYEVTCGQFRAFVKDTGYRTEPETDGQGAWGYDEETRKIEGRNPKYTWKFTGFAQTDEHPVVNVTWNDANAFC